MVSGKLKSSPPRSSTNLKGFSGGKNNDPHGCSRRKYTFGWYWHNSLTNVAAFSESCILPHAPLYFMHVLLLRICCRPATHPVCESSHHCSEAFSRSLGVLMKLRYHAKNRTAHTSDNRGRQTTQPPGAPPQGSQSCMETQTSKEGCYP